MAFPASMILYIFISFFFFSRINPAICFENVNTTISPKKTLRNDTKCLHIDESLSNRKPLKPSKPPNRSLMEQISRIFGGEDVQNMYERERYQYFVLTHGQKTCGGSLISNNVVLTAAHCDDAFHRVAVGIYSYFDSTSKYEMMNAEKKVIHPDYNPQTFDNDYMLVFLDNNSSFTPVQLADENFRLKNGTKLYSVGFGLTENGYPSRTLLEVDLDYIENKECTARYCNNFLISDNMMCTDSKGNKDTCKGDSGGPLILKGSNNEEDILVGVISWAVSCGSWPGVYSRVSESIKWIMNTLQQHNVSLPSTAMLSPTTSDTISQPTVQQNALKAPMMRMIPSKYPSPFPMASSQQGSLAPSIQANESSILSPIQAKKNNRSMPPKRTKRPK